MNKRGKYNSMSWFEDWFDSSLYEVLYADRNEDEAAQLIELLEDSIEPDKGATILDLGCGRGRHSILLAQKGYSVTGIDLSERAIETAQERAARNGLDNLRLLVWDMRHALDKKFDLILNLFTTFGYFGGEEENKRVLDNVSSMLNPGGVFVLDYMNSEKVEATYKQGDQGRIGNTEFSISRWISGDRIHKRIEFSGEGVEEQATYSEHVKLYGLDWFRKALSTREFEVDRVFGDYNGGEFDPNTSDRLIMISRKK